MAFTMRASHTQYSLVVESTFYKVFQPHLLNDTPPNLIAIFELTPLTIIWNAPRSYIIGLCCHMYNISIVYTRAYSSYVLYLSQRNRVTYSQNAAQRCLYIHVLCTDKCVMCVIHTVHVGAHWVFDVLTSLSIVVAHWLHWLHTSRSHFDDNDKYDDGGTRGKAVKQKYRILIPQNHF